MKSEKFADVPLEADTRLRFQQELQCGGFDALHQKWSWEGIAAESIIFENRDVEGVEEEALKEMVRSLPFCEEDSEMTFKRSESGFTYVNFNFVVD